MHRTRAAFRLACLAALLPSLLCAQTAPPPDPPTYVLKVRETLLQVPVLVLSPGYRRVPAPDPHDFTISLDGGPPSTPAHVRPEGDDPLSLAILIDRNGGDQVFFPRLAQSLAALVPGSLHPQDEVVLYALGCKLTRISLPLAAVPTRLTDQVKSALALLAAEPHQACGSARMLAASLRFLIKEQAHAPGRRAILALSAGYTDIIADSSSRWADVRRLANIESTAIFALTEQSPDPADGKPEDRLNTLCKLSGGIILRAYPSAFQSSLAEFLAMLRSRSILEFRFPTYLHPGPITLEVKLRHSNSLIFPAGTSGPLPDPADQLDPTVYHPDPSLAPELGHRRVLSPN